MTAAGENPYLPPEATGSAPGRGRLAGRRVLVVGAGTRPSPEPDPPIGNGRAIAVLAAREGASVVCADRDEAAAEVTAGLVRAEGSRAAVVLADVADPKACEAVVAESVEALGGLDGLVLNVGFALGRGITGTTAEQWDATFAVNTRAHFLVSAAALPVLAPRSSIVYISSAASLRAATGAPSYDSSNQRPPAGAGRRRHQLRLSPPWPAGEALGRRTGRGQSGRRRRPARAPRIPLTA